MTVTDIKPGKRGLMYVYIDGEYAFSAYPDILYDFSLSISSVVDTTLLECVLNKQNTMFAKRKTLDILSATDCSEQALYAKLIAKGIPEKHAAAAVSYAVEQGFVNDERYITDLVKYLFETKKYGVRRVKEYLTQKGFERSLIDNVIENYAPNSVPIIIDLLKKLPPDDLADKKAVAKTVEHLMRKGFVYADIRAAINLFASLELEFSEE